MENTNNTLTGIWDEYEIMTDFAGEMPPPYSEKLESALEGKGAFRRFKDMVGRLELTEHWYSYRDSKCRREIREWCDAIGIDWAASFA